MAKTLGMNSAYIGSAKTGDHINQMFFKACADLAGVKVTRSQIEEQQYYRVESKTKKKRNKRNEDMARQLGKVKELTPEEKIAQERKKDESSTCNIF